MAGSFVIMAIGATITLVGLIIASLVDRYEYNNGSCRQCGYPLELERDNGNRHYVCRRCGNKQIVSYHSTDGR